MDIACVPVEVFFEDYADSSGGANAIQSLKEVEVILGRDTTTQQVFLIFANPGASPDSSLVDVLIVELDRQSNQLTRFLALIQIAKQQRDRIESD